MCWCKLKDGDHKYGIWAIWLSQQRHFYVRVSSVGFVDLLKSSAASLQARHPGQTTHVVLRQQLNQVWATFMDAGALPE